MKYPKIKKIESFLTAGLVDYSDVDDGKYLLRKETIEKMLPSLEGRPLIVDHQKVTENNIDDIAIGYITKGWFNPSSGSFDCECIVIDDGVLDLGKTSVSCAYVPTELGEGGRYSGINYDAEVLGGEFTHVAIVDSPRYNDAKILINKIGEKLMLKRLLKTEKRNEVVLKEDDILEWENEEFQVKDVIEALKEAKKGEEREEDKILTSSDYKKEEEKEVEEDKEKDKEEVEKFSGCKKNEEDALAQKIERLVALALKKHLEKQDEGEEEDEEKETEEIKETKEAKEKSNSLKLVASSRGGAERFTSYETRADRIARSNEAYRK